MQNRLADSCIHIAPRPSIFDLRRRDGRRPSLRPPDDLLQHILSFAPARVAAASAILSRRWRPLWPRTNAVNLDIRSYLAADDKGFSISSSTVDVFFHDAVAALSAFPRHTCLKRLTLFLSLRPWYGEDHDEPGDDGKVAGLLAGNPPTAELEELLTGCQFTAFTSRNYGLPVASLACAATLRVLELERCNLQPPSAPSLAFPRLTERLRNCFFVEGYLQAMLDATATLTSLLLVNVAQRPLEPPDLAHSSLSYDYPTYHRLPLRLRCLTCTVLELETYPQDKEFEISGHIGIQLDMPSLRSFRFLGDPVKLTLISPAPGLVGVNLDATYCGHLSNLRRLEPKSRMLTSISTTRGLKLTVSTMEGEKEHGGVILPTFPNLKLLHLDVFHESRKSSIMALSMARLLRSCPAMSELRLMMWWNYDYVLEKEDKDPSTNAFAQSMDRFEKLACTNPSHSTSKVSDLHADLAENCASFSCLWTSLRKVTLLFRTKEVDCFQVQLAKFLVENAMVLEEMYIDDGNQFWQEHIRHKLLRWRADSFRTRNLPDTAGFQVHPIVW